MGVLGCETESACYDDELDSFLQEIGKKYLNLTSKQRIKVLDYLIDISGAPELFHLSETLPLLTKRNFIHLLPPELQSYLLQFLDETALLASCQVSRYWRDVVSSCREPWRRMCAKVGVALNIIEKEHDASTLDYKKLFHEAVEWRCLQNQENLDEVILKGHSNRVMAVAYWNGKIATGGDDLKVNIWDCSTWNRLTEFITHSVADLKFDDEWLVTGSFDGTAACWDVSTGQINGYYRGHISAVFSIDFDSTLDILVTGSPDQTVKVWKMSKPDDQHQTLYSKDLKKVLQVKLCKSLTSETFVIARNDNQIVIWNLKTADCIHVVKLLESIIVPGLFVQENSLHFVALHSSGNTTVQYIHKIGIINPNEQRKEVIPVSGFGRVTAYLGSSQVCHAFLQVEGYQLPTVQVLHRKNKTWMTSLSLTHGFRRSTRGGTFVLGDQTWLEGYTWKPLEGVVFLSAHMDSSVHVIKWKGNDKS